MGSQEAQAAIASWSSTMVVPPAVGFAKQVVAQAGPPRPARARALLFAVSRLADFAVAKGLELSPEVVFGEEVIERFVAESKANVSAPTRRTMRTNLRSLGRAVAAYPVPRPLPLTREKAKRPYTEMEISAYLALADAQPAPARAVRASALVCLGAGAGLVGADLRAVRGSDVALRSGGLVVVAKGRRPRVVPVLARYHHRLLVAAGLAGDGLLVASGPYCRNVTNQLVSSLAGSLPRLEVARLRATWLAEVARGIGLRAFMEAAGVDVSQRLGDIVAGLPELAEAESVRLLGASAC